MIHWIVATIASALAGAVGLGALARKWDRRARNLIVVLGLTFPTIVVGVYADRAERDLRQLRFPVATTTTTVHY